MASDFINSLAPALAAGYSRLVGATSHWATEGFEPVDRFFYRNRVTPLLPVSDFRRVPVLKTLQPQFVDRNGNWTTP